MPGTINTIARAQAAFEGRKRYNTGIPCMRGHLADRQTSNGGCLECARPKIMDRPSETQLPVQFCAFMPADTTRQEMDNLQVYLMRCVVHYCETIGKPHVMNATKLHEMNATGRPYGEPA